MPYTETKSALGIFAVAAKKNKTISSGTAQSTEARLGGSPFVVPVGASGVDSHPLERFLTELTVGEAMAVALAFSHHTAPCASGSRLSHLPTS
jgi:hypothetical protein